MRSRRGLAFGAAAGAAWWTWHHATSPSVGAWSPSAGTRRRAGPLMVRTLGRGGPAIVLLHGIMSSGDSFGAAFDDLARDHQLVVPDLFGFGRSMHAGTDFALDDHLDALDAMTEALEIVHTLWAVAGHSMGGVLALHWAARHAPQVRRVVTWGAPLHTTRAAALGAIEKMGWLEHLFVLDTPLSRATCAWSCRHRRLAGWLAAATNPDMPVRLSRQSSLHTWPAYRGALDDIVLASDWQPALESLAANDVHVTLTRGAADPVSDPVVLDALATRYAGVDTATHPTIRHELPLAEPEWCVTQLMSS